MNTKKFCIKAIMFFVVIVSLSSFSFAQSASFFTTVFEAEQLTWEQAAFLVMAGTERVSDSVSPNQAWESLSKTQWYTNIPERGSAITVSQLSYLLTKAFEVKGGLWFTLFGNERYSYRELVFKKVIPGSLDPQSTISGTEAMKVLEKAMAFFPVSDDNQAEAVK